MNYSTLIIAEPSLQKIVKDVRLKFEKSTQVELSFKKLPPPIEFKKLLLNLKSELPEGKWFLSKKDGIVAGVLFNLNFSRPRRAVIEIANGCNLKCDFCWTHSPLLKNAPDTNWLKQVLEPAVVYKYIEELHRFGTVELIEFCAIGDPLYHPNIWEFIEFAKAKEFKLRLSTNGTLLFPQKWDKHCPNSIDELFMNISAGDRDTYADIHNVGPGIFDQLIKNLKHIGGQRKAANLPLKMSWINIITDKNIGNIEQILDTGLEAGADYFDFRYVWVHKEAQQNIGVTHTSLSKQRANLIKIGERIEKFRIKSNFHEFVKSIDFKQA